MMNKTIMIVNTAVALVILLLGGLFLMVPNMRSGFDTSSFSLQFWKEKYEVAVFPHIDTTKAAPVLPEVHIPTAEFDPYRDTMEQSGSIAMVGDIMTARGVERHLRAAGDYTLPFKEMAPFLKSADITFGNLETSLMPGNTIPGMTFYFRADPDIAPAMKEYGFDVISLANNHSYDKLLPGMESTLDVLDGAGLVAIGAGHDIEEASECASFDVDGISVAICAFMDPVSSIMKGGHDAGVDKPGIAVLEEDLLTRRIDEAKKTHDLVFVSMHYGTEYVTEPNSRQIYWSEYAIDAGADMIIGHHSHTSQRVYMYKGKPVVSSLANYIFDNYYSSKTMQSVVGVASFDKEGVFAVDFVPLYMRDVTTTYPAPEYMFPEIFGRLGDLVDENGHWQVRDMEYDADDDGLMDLGDSTKDSLEVNSDVSFIVGKIKSPQSMEDSDTKYVNVLLDPCEVNVYEGGDISVTYSCKISLPNTKLPDGVYPLTGPSYERVWSSTTEEWIYKWVPIVGDVFGIYAEPSDYDTHPFLMPGGITLSEEDSREFYETITLVSG